MTILHQVAPSVADAQPQIELRRIVIDHKKSAFLCFQFWNQPGREPLRPLDESGVAMCLPRLARKIFLTADERGLTLKNFPHTLRADADA